MVPPSNIYSEKGTDMNAKRHFMSRTSSCALRAASWPFLVIDTPAGTYQPTQKLNSEFAGGVFGK
jgi:hypothetical protein